MYVPRTKIVARLLYRAGETLEPIEISPGQITEDYASNESLVSGGQVGGAVKTAEELVNRIEVIFEGISDPLHRRFALLDSLRPHLASAGQMKSRLAEAEGLLGRARTMVSKMGRFTLLVDIDAFLAERPTEGGK